MGKPYVQVLDVVWPRVAHVYVLIVVVEEVVELWPIEPSVDDADMFTPDYKRPTLSIVKPLRVQAGETTAVSVPIIDAHRVDIAHHVDNVLSMPQHR